MHSLGADAEQNSLQKTENEGFQIEINHATLQIIDQTFELKTFDGREQPPQLDSQEELMIND